MIIMLMEGYMNNGYISTDWNVLLWINKYLDYYLCTIRRKNTEKESLGYLFQFIIGRDIFSNETSNLGL